MSFLSRVRLTLQWIEDLIEGDFIEQHSPEGRQYCKNHLSFEGSISQHDLTTICLFVNDVLAASGVFALRISNSMGEIVPIWK